MAETLLEVNGLHGGYGRIPDNPTILPRNYAEGLLVVLVSVWLGVLLVGAVASRLSHRHAN